MKIGDKVFMEYEVGEFIGMEGDKYMVRYKKKDEEITKSVVYEPIPFRDDFPKYIKDKYSYFMFTGKVHSWLRNGCLKLYPNYKSSSIGNEIKSISEEDLQKYEVIDNTFFEEDIVGFIEEIDSEIYPLQNKINDLRKQIAEIEKKKKQYQDICFHDWCMSEEESTGRNFLGDGFKQEGECSICGKQSTKYYTRL